MSTGGEAGFGAPGSTVAALALRSAAAVLRLLLPGRRVADDEPCTWARVASARGSTEPISGMTSWTALVEYDGRGQRPEVDVEHPIGRFSAEVVEMLGEAVRGSGCLVNDWSYLMSAERQVPRADLRAPLLSEGDVEAPAEPFPAPAPLTVSALNDLLTEWVEDGFHGRAWSPDLSVAFAAPAYADSVIISCPTALAESLLASRLEVFPIARSVPSPITAE